MKKSFVLLLSLSMSTFAQPNWLASDVGGVSPSRATPPTIEKIVYRTKTKIDTLLKVDTINVIDTLFLEPLVEEKKIDYTYLLSICQVSERKLIDLGYDVFNFDYKTFFSNLYTNGLQTNCIMSKSQSDENFIYRYGGEDLIDYGYIVDQVGNRLPQYKERKTGITLKVFGEKIYFDHSLSKDLQVEGVFIDDRFQLFTSYEQFFVECKLFIFCSNSTEKIYIIGELKREERL